MKAEELGAWQALLQEELEKPYWRTLSELVDAAYAAAAVYPPREALFAAFRLTPPEAVRAVRFPAAADREHSNPPPRFPAGEYTNPPPHGGRFCLSNHPFSYVAFQVLWGADSCSVKSKEVRPFSLVTEMCSLCCARMVLTTYRPRP